MFATLFRSATSKGLVAGLAAVVATAGIGVAVAAPTETPEEPAALAIGTSDGIDEIDDDADFAVNPQVDVLVPTTVIDDDAEVDESEDDSTPAPPVATNFSRSAASPPVIPPANADRFLAEGDLFNRDLLKGLLPDEVTSDDVAEGAEELAQEVIARIEECVGGVVGDFGSDFDFDGSNGASGRGFDADADGSAGFDESFATSIVDDLLPCVSGLVDDALACVSGLVEEILATVMSMDFEEIAGMAGIIVDELVNCVGDVEADQAS